MATKTLPRRGSRLSRGWMVGIVLIVVVGAAALFLRNGARSTSQVSAASTVVVRRGNIVGSVTGSGAITADQILDQAFQTSGSVTQVLVQEGDTVTAGQVLARLDDRMLQSQVANARASLDSAKARLLQSQEGNARPEDLASAQASVNSAQAAYNTAVKDAAAGDSTLAALKAVLDKAQVTLQQKQSAYDQVAWRSDVGRTQQAADLQNATIDYQKAKGDYEAQLKTSGPDAQSRIQSALATLQQAQAGLAKLTAPATDTDLAIQQAAVAQAQQALTQAQLSLEYATLRAPFAGIVTAVNIVPGSTVNASTPAVGLMGRNPMHVNLKLSENDVVKVQLGQPATLTIDSLSDWRAEGQVSYIAPASETSNGVVTYAVRINFSDSDPRVRVGMTANLDIVTARKDNVLLVPNSALLPKGSGHVVQVIGPDGKAKEVDVQTGITDATQTEITSGLSEGMKIVALPGSNTTPRPAGPFGG
jgi:HlyD family secretion protein